MNDSKHPRTDAKLEQERVNPRVSGLGDWPDFVGAIETELYETEAKMIQWRGLAQEMTPGGSEFMHPDAVRAYYREQKDETHQAKIDRVKSQRELTELSSKFRREQDVKNAVRDGIIDVLRIKLAAMTTERDEVKADYMRSQELAGRFANERDALLADKARLDKIGARPRSAGGVYASWPANQSIREAIDGMRAADA